MRSMALRSTGVAPAFASTAGIIETALSLRAQGRHRDALSLLSDPRHASQDVCVLRGDIHQELSQFELAIESYSKAVAKEPGNVYARLNLALCLRKLNRWAQAAGAFQALLDCD